MMSELICKGCVVRHRVTGVRRRVLDGRGQFITVIVPGGTVAYMRRDDVVVVSRPADAVISPPPPSPLPHASGPTKAEPLRGQIIMPGGPGYSEALGHHKALNSDGQARTRYYHLRDAAGSVPSESVEERIERAKAEANEEVFEAFLRAGAAAKAGRKQPPTPSPSPTQAGRGGSLLIIQGGVS